MAVKLTQKQVKEKSDEWAEMDHKIGKLEAKRDAELDPFVKKHQADIAPICEKYEPRLNALRDRKTAIEAEVIAWLESHGKPIALDASLAVAANEVKVGNRVLGARAFFDFVKDKTPAFWACLTVGIAKAEELIGKKQVDALAEKPTKLVASLKLK